MKTIKSNDRRVEKRRFSRGDEVFLRQRCYSSDWLGREGVVYGFSRHPNFYRIVWNGTRTPYRYPSWALSFSFTQAPKPKRKAITNEAVFVFDDWRCALSECRIIKD